MGRSATPLYLELIRTTPGTPFTRDKLKLERLRELRATIDALRGEPDASDLLLAGALENVAVRQRR